MFILAALMGAAMAFTASSLNYLLAHFVNIFKMNWFPTVRELTLALVRAPSVTESDGESNFAAHVKQVLLKQPYFQANPQHIQLLRTQHDFRERYVICALVRGNGSQTVLLTGHYDTVSTANYGALEPWATDPEALLPRQIDELKQHAASDSDLAALHDLQSGDYLPGRGTLDMKSGLAVGLALLQQFAEQPDRHGNLLFAAVCDEENYSHGMRSTLTQLPALAAQWGLDLQAAINLDAGLNNPDGSEARSIYLGSVGKFLPTAFFVGRPTHAGAPFDGINANLLSSEFVRLCEAGDALADPSPTLGEMPPAPVCLQQLDLKGYYDVTTPSAAWCAFNVLTYSATPAELLARLHTAAAQAVTNAITHMQQRAKRYTQQSGIATQLNCGAAQVFTFEQLTALAQQRSGANWAAIADEIAQHAADMTLNALSVSRTITARLVQAAQLQGPAAIVGFAPVYYPVALLNSSSGATRLRHIVETEAAALNRTQNAGIRLQHFIPGIADMSFFGTQASATQYPTALMPNLTPAWDMRWWMPNPSQALQLPSVNIGPCGRDYHQRTERVYMPYSFGILPELVWRISLALLKN